MDFSAITVLAVGDVMLDRFVEGDIDRISPEAPVPVLRLLRTREMPGGAGNVASNIASLGARAILIGLVGRDTAAQTLRRTFEATGRIEAALVTSAHRPTICKTRFIASRQQVVRTDEESLAPLERDEEAALIEAIDRHAGTAQSIILSDYGKSTLSPRVVAHAMALAAARDLPVFVDPKGDDFSIYHGATCITPNQKELARASHLATGTQEAVVAACSALMSRVDTRAILATRSEKGMILVERSGEVTTVSARAREVFDVSGAGDTVIATLAVAHASGRTLAGSMRIANAAAGVVVSKLGTATANIAELVHELDAADHERGTPSSVLQPLDRAAALVDHWKEQGLAVGFTNGCFDVLHAGHVSLLAMARSRCDRLVVALNTDASTARLKGPTRPINPLADRAAVMAAIRHVDCVIAFDDDTPLALIRALRPDILVKGADYRLDEVVGAEFAAKVILAELTPGLSTTATIEKASRAAGLNPEPGNRQPAGHTASA